MALEVMVAGKWIDDIKACTIHDQWFECIAQFLANRNQRPVTPSASSKECKLWVSVQRFYLKENGLLLLLGN
jgi:hypothetical protein